MWVWEDRLLVIQCAVLYGVGSEGATMHLGTCLAVCSLSSMHAFHMSALQEDSCDCWTVRCDPLSVGVSLIGMWGCPLWVCGRAAHRCGRSFQGVNP